MCSTSPAEGFPWDNLRKIFGGCQRMAKVPNATEILPKISIAWAGRTNVTDRRQTDGRAIAYSEREREFTFAKNQTIVDRILHAVACRTFTVSQSLFATRFVNWYFDCQIRQVCQMHDSVQQWLGMWCSNLVELLMRTSVAPSAFKFTYGVQICHGP